MALFHSQALSHVIKMSLTPLEVNFQKLLEVNFYMQKTDICSVTFCNTVRPPCLTKGSSTFDVNFIGMDLFLSKRSLTFDVNFTGMDLFLSKLLPFNRDGT